MILNLSDLSHDDTYGTMKGMSIKAHPPQHALHVPVLLEKTVELLHPQLGDSYLDLTAGYGGHATAILNETQNPKDAVLVDRDENAIAELQNLKEKGAVLLHTDFVSAAQQLIDEGRQFNIVLVDLGCRHLSSIELIGDFHFLTMDHSTCVWTRAVKSLPVILSIGPTRSSCTGL